MKFRILGFLALSSITVFAQQKEKVVSALNSNEAKIKKTNLTKFPKGQFVDTIQLKPGSTPPPATLYNNEQIGAIIMEAGEYYNQGFTTEQNINMIKTKFNLSLAQATRVMYNAYFFKNKKQVIESSWPYDLQLAVSKAYNSKDILTLKLLKDGGETIHFPFEFFYWHFLLLLGGNNPSDGEAKVCDHFKMYIDAAYDPEEIYSRAVHPLVPIERNAFAEFFYKGMKKANVPVTKLLPVMNTWGLPGVGYELLLKAGYTQAEINNATAK